MRVNRIGYWLLVIGYFRIGYWLLVIDPCCFQCFHGQISRAINSQMANDQCRK